MKKVTMLFTVLAMLALSETSQAEATSCFIYLAGPCESVKQPAYQWFLDSDPAAQIDPVRCAARANEYFLYCKGGSGKAAPDTVYTTSLLATSKGSQPLVNTYKNAAGSGIFSYHGTSLGLK